MYQTKFGEGGKWTFSASILVKTKSSEAAIRLVIPSIEAIDQKGSLMSGSISLDVDQCTSGFLVIAKF